METTALKKTYKEQIVPALQKQFGYKSKNRENRFEPGFRRRCSRQEDH